MDRVKKLIAWTTCQDGVFSTMPAAFGPDQIYIFDDSTSDDGHEQTILKMKELARVSDIPLALGGRVKRLEDVKKYLYAGAKSVFLDSTKNSNVDLIKEAADRFGSEKISVLISTGDDLKRIQEFFQLGASKLIIEEDIFAGCDKKILAESLMGFDLTENQELYLMKRVADESAVDVTAFIGDLLEVFGAELKADWISGAMFPLAVCSENWFVDGRQQLKAAGIPVQGLESVVSFADFKLNSDGMIPVIVQDYKTDEVLMLAYMNEEAYLNTIKTGRMTYYSRSRESQWVKGETSGHFQYVKSLALDCDQDTILAKVMQIGPACHTGAKSCFFNQLAKAEYQEKNPLKVFDEVYQVIADRKQNPKEGSYTNYLFDKGIDKILKKVGEEATEIIIAAKNPDPEEIKYEISDFLYHAMVLMVEKGVAWEDIMEELANR